MLTPVRVTPATETPISLDEAKAHLREQSTDYDVLIHAYIQAAADVTEMELGRALVTSTWTTSWDAFDSPLELPLAPVQSVSSITYYDGNNALQTLATSVYGTYSNHMGAYIALLSGQSWPSVYTRDNALTVTFIAGYGGPDAIPAPIRAAIMIRVADMYAMAETFVTGTIAASIPSSGTVDRLLAPYKRWSV